LIVIARAGNLLLSKMGKYDYPSAARSLRLGGGFA
jgi:hypothetical protein